MIEDPPTYPRAECGSTAPEAKASLAAVGVATAVSVATVITRYEETLLSNAQTYIDADDFGVAVVVAHTACEICAERAISRALMKKEIGYLDAWIAKVLRNYNITNDGTKALYNLLTGNNIQIDLVCCWEDFKKSVERRNDFVHSGTRVTKPEAEASLKAVKQLVAYLNRDR
jgi:hypothetical protein